MCVKEREKCEEEKKYLYRERKVTPFRALLLFEKWREKKKKEERQHINNDNNAKKKKKKKKTTKTKTKTNNDDDVIFRELARQKLSAQKGTSSSREEDIFSRLSHPSPKCKNTRTFFFFFFFFFFFIQEEDLSVSTLELTAPDVLLQ